MPRQSQNKLQEASKTLLASLLVLLVTIQVVSCVITVQIGGATRLNSLSRQRDRYSCYWDCDLVGCQIARDDDECAYDCEKICRVKYDYAAAGRSGQGALSELKPKSGAPVEQPNEPAVAGDESELLGGKLRRPTTLTPTL